MNSILICRLCNNAMTSLCLYAVSERNMLASRVQWLAIQTYTSAMHNLLDMNAGT